MRIGHVTGRFYMCEDTLDKSELDKFTSQARGWRPLPNGKNTLRFDDAADIVRRCTDPLLQTWTPPEMVQSDKPNGSPYRQPEKDAEYQYATRYMSW